MSNMSIRDSNPELKSHYCVIGSGPVGSVVSLILLKQGFEVTMLDIAATQATADLKSKFYGKTILGRSFPYDRNEYLNLIPREDKREWHTSKGLYGFSTVWGATWIRDEIEDQYDVELDELIFQKNVVHPRRDYAFDQTLVCSCLSHLLSQTTHRLKFEIPQLLIDRNSCSFIGACQTGCTNNSIWSSQQLIEQCLKFKHFQLIKDVFVDRFEDRGGFVEIQFQNKESFLCQKLIIAAGPIGTAALLVKSDIVNSLELQDTQTRFQLFFSRKRLQKHQKKFALSTLSANFENSSVLMHIQYYPHVELALDRVFHTFPTPFRNVACFLLKLLSHHLVIGLIFYSPRLSDRIITSKAKTGINWSTRKRRLRRMRWLILNMQHFFISAGRGLVPIPFAGISKKVGESYHVGAAVKPAWDNFGRLCGNSNVYVAGAIALDTLVPGPVTKAAMKHGVKVARNLSH